MHEIPLFSPYLLWASVRLTTARDWLEPTTDFMLRSHLTRCAARLHLNGGRIPRERLPSARPLPCIRQFTVLALESSADDTCAAVVTSEREILSNVVISQHSQCVSFQSYVKNTHNYSTDMPILVVFIPFTRCRATKDLWSVFHHLPRES